MGSLNRGAEDWSGRCWVGWTYNSGRRESRSGSLRPAAIYRLAYSLFSLLRPFRRRSVSSPGPAGPFRQTGFAAAVARGNHGSTTAPSQLEPWHRAARWPANGMAAPSRACEP